MFEGMDIPWVSQRKPIEKPKPAPQPRTEEEDEDITKFGPAAFELLKRIIARALAPFPQAARAVGAHLRANARVLFNYGLPVKPVDYDALIVDPNDGQHPAPEPATS
jgi:hypothetical protein